MYYFHSSFQASENSDENNGNAPPPLTRVAGSGQEKENGTSSGAFQPFSRNQIRRSLANNVTMFRWLEAQQKQQQRFEVGHRAWSHTCFVIKIT